MLLSLGVSGCSIKKPDEETSSGLNITTKTEETTSVKETVPPITIKDYYPFFEDYFYIYEGEGNEYASYTVFIDYMDETRIQTRTNNGGTETVKVLEHKEGQLSRLLSREESYFRQNYLDNASGPEEILLMEPLTVGTSWTLPDGRKRFISNIDMEITTPASDYLALEVTTEGDNYKNYDYYVKNIGLVKTLFVSDGNEISSTLKEIKKNTPLTQNANFYYPNISKNILEPIEKKLVFYTNDSIEEIFKKAYENVSLEVYSKVIGENVKINKLFLDNDSIVWIDLSKEFSEELDSNSEYSTLVLQCITDTLRAYYGAEEVNITVEGKTFP